MRGEGVSEQALDSLSAAVAAETGIPMGRVKKVLLSAQRHQQVSPSAPRQSGFQAAQPDVPEDRLRFYPLGANGRTHPPLHQPRNGDADTPG